MSVPTSIKRVLLQRDVFGYGFALKNEHPCEVDFVLPNSVADLANVRCGDLLFSINGVSVIDSSHDQISSHIWSSGSPIEFEFLESNSGSMISSVSSNCRQSTGSQTVPQSPLFLSHSTNSQHKRYAMVTFVDKLRLHPQMDIRPKQLIQKLLPIKRKADQLVNEPTNLNSICLFEVHSDYLRIRMLSKTLEFSSSDLSFAGHFDEDRRFFYMITHGKHRVPCNAQSTTERPGPAVVTTSCCLFRCLPPALLGHRSHLQLTNQFLISCHRDRLTGDCSEFPRSVVPLVSDLLDLINRPINARTRLAESPIACDRVYPKPLRTSSTCTMGPPRQRMRGASSEVGTITPVCSAVVSFVCLIWTYTDVFFSSKSTDVVDSFVTQSIGNRYPP
ncbi:PDZ/DHR/GLGF domain protein [Paragonimus heterotremus]|uniref:PDZ/DHR/GLGF domain protein n=1 Tax=Paragonimus heterotremus TaxID=100268 RepID=A0A8J4SRT4_9TREM|nr:PDZ/DHR/GLGF domain protein [Paragonimus heterotremus]